MTPAAEPRPDPARGVRVVAAARHDAADLAGCSANRPSFYADPLAWLVAATIAEALRDCPPHALADPDEVGVVVVSSARALPTARLIASSTARGAISPLRFAGGNPGILAGLSCIQWRFRGPSMVLSAAAAGDHATVDAALALASSWLAAGQARSVFCVRHTQARETQARDTQARQAEPGQGQAHDSGPHTVAAVLLCADSLDADSLDAGVLDAGVLGAGVLGAGADAGPALTRADPRALLAPVAVGPAGPARASGTP